MFIKRNILYADRPTLCGKLFTITCLNSLAKEINESVNKRYGYTFDSTGSYFYTNYFNLSHHIDFVFIEGITLVAQIEILGNKSGVYLENHLHEYVFRPQATFYESNEMFFSIRHLSAMTAIKIDNDCYSSLDVMWMEHLASRKTPKDLYI